MLIAHDTAVNNYGTETIFNTLFNTLSGQGVVLNRFCSN